MIKLLEASDGEYKLWTKKKEEKLLNKYESEHGREEERKKENGEKAETSKMNTKRLMEKLCFLKK